MTSKLVISKTQTESISKRFVYKIVMKEEVKHIKFDNNFVFRTCCYFMINIYSKNVRTLKRNYKRKITDIGEDCSVCDEQETSATETTMETHEKLFTIESKVDRNSEEENIINKRSRLGRRRKKLSLAAESKTRPDGTVWKKIDANPKPFFFIRGFFFIPVFYLIIYYRIRDYVIKYTQEESFRVLGTKWELDTTKLDAFIALLYARGAYQTRNLDVSYLWNKI